MLLAKIFALTGKNLSEECIKMLCSTYLILTVGHMGCARLSLREKGANLTRIKQIYHRRRRQMGKPATPIQTLQSDPNAFKLKHPGLYSVIFGNAMPVPCKIPLNQLYALDNTYPCRGNGYDLRGPQLQDSSPMLQLQMQMQMQMQMQHMMQIQDGILTKRHELHSHERKDLKALANLDDTSKLPPWARTAVAEPGAAMSRRIADVSPADAATADVAPEAEPPARRPADDLAARRCPDVSVAGAVVAARHPGAEGSPTRRPADVHVADVAPATPGPTTTPPDAERSSLGLADGLEARRVASMSVEGAAVAARQSADAPGAEAPPIADVAVAGEAPASKTAGQILSQFAAMEKVRADDAKAKKEKDERTALRLEMAIALAKGGPITPAKQIKGRRPPPRRTPQKSTKCAARSELDAAQKEGRCANQSKVKLDDAQKQAFLKRMLEGKAAKAKAKACDNQSKVKLDDAQKQLFLKRMREGREAKANAQACDNHKKVKLDDAQKQLCLPLKRTREGKAAMAKAKACDSQSTQADAGGGGDGKKVNNHSTNEELPDGWRVVVKTRTSGKSIGISDKYYVPPHGVTAPQCRSIREVSRFIATGSKRIAR